MSAFEIFSGLGLLISLIILNGLFVAAEYALVSIRKSRVEEMVQSKQPQSGMISKLKSNIDRSIAGSQLGITLASLLIGWIGGDSILHLVKLALSFIPGLENFNPPASIAVVLSFLLLSLTHVIVGEQIPKQIALRLPEKVLVLLALPFRAFCFIATPFVLVMSFIANGALKLLGIHKVEAQEHKLPSPDEFQILFEDAEKAGTLGKQETDILKRALELKAVIVRDVMVPRTRIDFMADDLTLQAVLGIVSKTKHSKLPVYRGNRDTIVGILHTRDLFDLFHSTIKAGQTIAGNAAASFHLSGVVRKPFFAPDTMLASSLLEEMRERRMQMAIVVDEFGSTVGLVTMEDLLEQLVGEIQDEYDTPQIGIESAGDKTWRVLGEVTVADFNRELSVTLSCTMHCNTVAGAVIEALDHQPAVGDTVIFANLEFKVLEMRGQAIATLEVREVPPPAPQAGESPSTQEKQDGEPKS